MAENTAQQSPTEQERADEAQAQADFDSGMPDAPVASKPGAKADTKPEPKLDAKVPPAKPEIKPAVVKPPEPKYVRVTEDQFTAWNAAAAKSALYEKQFSTAFGTIGNMQKVLTALQTATPRGFKVEIPKDAFADMERDFPELAASNRKGLEAIFRGITGTGPANAEVDPEQMSRLIAEHAAKLRTDGERARLVADMKELEQDHPDWAKIVGKVDTLNGEKPDPNNLFRKWLATKPPGYQRRINSAESGVVISDAIDLYQSEVKAPATPVPSLKDQLRTARIRDAVQPRGDGGQAAPRNTDEDDFAAGYASR
jgi:hypothetical protein